MTYVSSYFQDKDDASRQELATYLCSVGQPVNVRLDIPILSVQDVKWTATLLEKLAKDLTEVAFGEGKVPTIRILQARSRISRAANDIAHRNKKLDTDQLMRQVRESRRHR